MVSIWIRLKKERGTVGLLDSLLNRPAGRMAGLTLVSLLMGWAQSASALELLKPYGDNAVLIRYDEFDEIVEIGDRMFVIIDGKKKGLLKVTKKGKGNLVLAEIVKGEAPAGAQLQPIQRVAPQQGVPPSPPPEQTSSTTEAPKEKNIEAGDSVSTTLLIFSDQVWRGMSVSNHSPNVKGVLNYDTKSRLNLGVVFGSSAGKNSEVDYYLNYTVGGEKWGVTLSALHFWFPEKGEINTSDVGVKLTISNLILAVEYIPNYFGSQSANLYYNLGTSFSLSKKWSMNLSAGMSDFAKNDLVGEADYMDYKLGLAYTSDFLNTEFSWTNDTRKDLSDVRMKDQTVAVTVSKTY